MSTDQTATTPDERLWALLAHLFGLLGYAVLFGQYAGPFIVYLMYKDRSRFVAFHALQSLYFQLALLVVGLIGVFVAIITCGIGAIPLALLPVAAFIYVVVAALKAYDGRLFEYWLVGEWARRQVEI